MSRPIRAIRHNAVRGAAALALMLALGACSSDKKPAPTSTTAGGTTTTVSLQQQIADLRAYVHGKGAGLLTYMRDTAVFGTGKVPAQTECSALLAKLTSEHLGNDDMNRLLRGIAATQTRSDWSIVVFGRNVILNTCAAGKRVDPAIASGNKYYTGVLRTKMKPYGITIP